MNRNQRIVVSIVGIIIVTLALIGITYAYFMTKIIGNSSTTSISGTLANLELTYGDGNGVIAPTDPIMPGDTLEKTFTVKNTGTVRVDNYAVILEDVTNELTRKDDLVYTLECVSDDDSPCNEVNNELNFPSGNGILILNSIEKEVTHTYTLTITYKKLDDIDQSDDMGKKFSAKINITNSKYYNPYSDNIESLAYKIINNYSTPELYNTPTFQANIVQKDLIDSLKYSLNFGVMNDAFGKSYFFSGNILNNYIDFANMCWRIVRIEGDGGIKITLDDDYFTSCSKTDGRYSASLLIPKYLMEAPEYLQSWYDTTLINYKENLLLRKWLYGDEWDNFSNNGYLSLNKTTCESAVDSYVGMLTADEVVLSGITSAEYYNSAWMSDRSAYSYLILPKKKWLTSTKSIYPLYVDDDEDSAIIYTTESTQYIRPTVVLNPNTIVTGQGTKADPYIVK